MGISSPTPGIDLGENQPSVSRSVVVVRLVAVSSGLGGVALAAGAWHSGSLAWLVAYLIYSLALFFGVAFVSSIPRHRQRRLDHDWARRFHELSIRDELTGLYNRRYFNQQLESLITRCRDARQPLTVALIDLNEFKSINDTFGHHAGDAALQVVASCITRAVGDGGIVARTGGDEFAIIFPGLGSVESVSRVATAQALLHAASLPLGGANLSDLRLEAAVGFAFLDEFNQASHLLRGADNALYANKRELGRLHDRHQAS